jgi:hypothetical protein
MNIFKNGGKIKMKRATIIIGAILFCFSLAVTTLFADDHSDKEVKSIIKKVEQALDKYNESGAEKWAGKELNAVEDYIKNAKAFFDEGDIDEAWYEIGKAEAYFKLIDAKKEFSAAEKEYKGTQEK